jgi:hypothetical protein
LYGRLKSAGRPLLEQGETTCCYAHSEKTWVHDPQGVAWEAFLTVGESPVYGEDAELKAAKPTAACCSPSPSGLKPAAFCMLLRGKPPQRGLRLVNAGVSKKTRLGPRPPRDCLDILPSPWRRQER